MNEQNNRNHVSVSFAEKLNAWMTNDNFVIVMTSNIVSINNNTDQLNQTCGYSLGLNLQGIHDFVIFAEPAIAAKAISNVVDWIRKGNEIKLDTVCTDLIPEFPVVFKEVNNEKINKDFKPINLYKTQPRHKTIQIVTPDSDQIFPWEEGYNPEHDEKQTLLF